MYFGERHFDTLKEFDHLKKSLRRSRTGTLDYLLNYYKQTEKRRVQPVILWWLIEIRITLKDLITLEMLFRVS